MTTRLSKENLTEDQFQDLLNIIHASIMLEHIHLAGFSCQARKDLLAEIMMSCVAEEYPDDLQPLFAPGGNSHAQGKSPP